MRLLTDSERKIRNFNMLCYFDKFCRDNDIKYSLTGGTLLGAVRHKGFIPWDDDVDVFMTRPEFNKLDKLFVNTDTYEYVSRTRDSRYGYSFGKILDKKTVILDAGGMPSEGKGIFLDVCVVDGLPNNSFFRMIHIKKMRCLYKGRRAVCFDKSNDTYYEKGLVSITIKRMLAKFTSIQLWLRLMDKEMKRYKFDKGIYVGNFTSQYGERELLHRSVFDSYIEMEFNGKKFMVCQGWEEYLKNIYGDYMKLPPENKRRTNHIGKAYLVEE